MAGSQKQLRKGKKSGKKPAAAVGWEKQLVLGLY